jgi:hypothetical protein
MKIEVKKTSTMVECTADELRQSNSLSDCLTNTLRTLFIGTNGTTCNNTEEEDDNDED